jgi:hypothetical protein
MASTIRSLDGTVIEGGISKTGTFAAFDWERLVLPPIRGRILDKAAANADWRLDGFTQRDRERLTNKLGHYSDVQSLNCEDTFTYSVFGFADEEVWLNDMLSDLFGPAERPDVWNPALWSRIRHPDTGKVEHGPESDVVLENGGWRYVIEAKWTQDISVHKHGQNSFR